MLLMLGAAILAAYGVDVYDIDMFESAEQLILFLHDSGRKVVCYFIVGSYTNW